MTKVKFTHKSYKTSRRQANRDKEYLRNLWTKPDRIEASDKRKAA